MQNYSTINPERFANGSRAAPLPLKTGTVGLRRSTLVLIALAAAFFPRVLAAVGFPAFVNFAHFAVVLLFFFISLNLTGKFNRRIIFGLLALLGVIAFSAFFNEFAVVNAALDFLLLGEPFLLLSIIVAGRWTADRVKKFRFVLFAYVLIHVAFAFVQRLVFNLTDDDVKGVFLNQGAGHHVGGGVALTAAVYFVVVPWTKSIRWRVALGLACFMVVIFSDSKQVLLAFLISMGLMMFLRAGNFRRLTAYAGAAVGSGLAIYVLATTVFPALGVWMNIYKIHDGLAAKWSVFPYIARYFDSPLDWLFGLGPGGSVGRLAWLIPDYYRYLQPLGVTASDVPRAIIAVQEANWISNSVTGSSIWSLTFSWAGVWGDLGFLGTSVYLYLWWLVWRHVCRTDVSKYLLLTVFVFGFIFAWMEEPGFMLIVIAFIGLQCHEARLADEAKVSPISASESMPRFGMRPKQTERPDNTKNYSFR